MSEHCNDCAPEFAECWNDKSKCRKQPSSLAATTGYVSRVRVEEAKARQTACHLEECDQLLTAAGVPEWVMNSKNEGVPANSTPERLRWYLARRKDVESFEIDHALHREMKKWLELVARHNAEVTGQSPVQ